MDEVYCHWRDLKLTPFTQKQTHTNAPIYIYMNSVFISFEAHPPPAVNRRHWSVWACSQTLVCVCVCQLRSLYVLWPVGFVFVFVMWQDSDRLMAHHVMCLHLFICVCVYSAGRHTAFIPKNNPQLALPLLHLYLHSSHLSH